MRRKELVAAKVGDILGRTPTITEKLLGIICIELAALTDVVDISGAGVETRLEEIGDRMNG